VTGTEYANLIAAYISSVYGARGLEVYREVSLGKSIIGKNRRIDVFLRFPETEAALAVECKYQDVSGTVDEKIPYALNDIESMWIRGCVVYAGRGFSEGVIHMLQGSSHAAYCLPEEPSLGPSIATRELDHIIASVFGWWDVLLQKKSTFDLADWSAKRGADSP
jgi:hypothetical protein